MNEVGVPASIHGSFQGTAAVFQQSLSSEPVLILSALAAVYIVLGILYESYIHPITILSTLPSAGMGAVLALRLFNTEFSIIALIGVILLIGIVKKNAIMMIDFALDAQRHHGKDPASAIYEAALLRFRPIMMTTMAAMLGALPLAFGYRRRRGTAPAAGHLHRRRPDREPGAHPLHHAGDVPVPGPLRPLGQPLVVARPSRSPRPLPPALRTRRIMKTTPPLFLSCALLALAGCAVGPNYHRPSAPVPQQFKEAEGWKPAAPAEPASGTAWWSVYNDPVLDELERQIDISNQTLKASEAAWRESRALVSEARAAYLPTVGLSADATRAGGRATTSSTGGVTVAAHPYNSFEVAASASWDLDIWGKIRRTVESQLANAQASEAELAAARLSAQAALATDYIDLRVADETKKLLDETVAAYQRSLTITQNQYQAGIVAKADVITAQTQLGGAQSQQLAIGVTPRHPRARHRGAGRQGAGGLLDHPGALWRAACRWPLPGSPRRCWSATRRWRPPSAAWPRRMPRSAWRSRRTSPTLP